jgi:hypothetical protein
VDWAQPLERPPCPANHPGPTQRLAVGILLSLDRLSSTFQLVVTSDGLDTKYAERATTSIASDGEREVPKKAALLPLNAPKLPPSGFP